MHINLETPDSHTIQAYTDHDIKINNTLYQHSLVISREIITPWDINSLQQLDEATLKPLLQLNPEIIIIGHNQPGNQMPMTILQQLSKLRIGVECMSIGAACRTFNVLLGEQRAVVAGIIFSLA